jgi:hypothetical protein
MCPVGISLHRDCTGKRHNILGETLEQLRTRGVRSPNQQPQSLMRNSALPGSENTLPKLVF